MSPESSDKLDTVVLLGARLRPQFEGCLRGLERIDSRSGRVSAVYPAWYYVARSPESVRPIGYYLRDAVDIILAVKLYRVGVRKHVALFQRPIPNLGPCCFGFHEHGL